MTNPDLALGDTAPDAPTPASAQAGGAFAFPSDTAGSTMAAQAIVSRTIEDVLAMARRPERYATIYLRADLDAERDRLVLELSTLVTPAGEVIDDTDDALGDEPNSARAQRLSDQIRAIDAERNASAWSVLFRGLPPEDLDVFNKRHRPKNRGDDLTDYHARLVAECAIEPALSYEQVQQLRRQLGNAAYMKFVKTALDVNTEGGVDMGKSPSFLVAPKVQ